MKKNVTMKTWCAACLATATLMCGGVLSACESDDVKSREAQAGRRAVAFAQAYYNQHYDKATELVTPESRKWIAFFVSNMTDGDLEVLAQYPEASMATIDEVMLTSDSTAEVSLVVDHAFVADSLGKPGHMEDDKKLKLSLVQREKNWMVVLSASL